MNHSLSTQLHALRTGQLDWATPNYCFRSFVKADVYPLLSATKHKSFNKFLLWNQPVSVEATMVQVQKLLREETLNQSATFSIVSKHTGAWVGFLRWIPYQDGLAISLWVHPDYWGKGAARELVDCTFDVVYKTTTLENLFAFIQPENLPSIRLVTKKKMSIVQTLSLLHEDGQPREVQVFHTSRSNWFNPQTMESF